MGKPENALQRACLEFLALRRVFAWRNNTGAFKVAKRFVAFGTKGSGDIFAIVPPHGRFLSIECKTPTGRVSIQQKAWAAVVEAYGGVAIVARSVDDVQDALNDMDERESDG